tara:strand:+ start:248 stop:802 length:555 start_codon:yes stop_codon:yes gene_type:complete
MTTEVQLSFLNLNTFFLIGLIILIGGYLYYEIHKMKQILNDYDYQLYQIKSILDNNKESSRDTEELDHIIKDDNDIINDDIINDDIIKDDITKDDDIDDVDDVWNEINDLMENNENKDNNDLDTLNVSENGSSKQENIEDLLDDNHVPDYMTMTVSQLKNILIDMKLPVSGNKTKLIERINNNK